MNMNNEKDARQQIIITAAEELFAHFGLRKTTMEDIASKSKMGKSTLYYYFKSKEDIFAEVIHKESKILQGKLSKNIQLADTPQAKIDAYVYTRMKHLKKLSNYYLTLTDEYLEQYAFVERARQHFLEYEMNSLISILQEGIEDGAFQVADVEETARAIAIAIKGLEYPLLIQKEPNDMESTITSMLNILFKGIESR